MIRSIVRLGTVALMFALAPSLNAQLTQELDEGIMETMRWRSLGPANMMGRVSDVEGIPSPSKTFYVATAGGGVWKTTNNGITFKSLFNSERVVATGDLAIDPNNHDVIWLGTGEEDSRNSISAGGGVYKSTDGGDSWELMGLKETQTVGRIIVHPVDGDIVYVAALGHIWDSNPERGLYRTKDGGETWDLVKFISDKAGFVDLAMHPQNPDVLFASSWERVRGPYFLNSGGPGSALWKSTDGGDSWTEVSGGGFPSAMKGRIGIAISMSQPDIMYALVEAEDEEDGSLGTGLYRSEDGGDNWEKMNDVDSRPFYYSQVRVDPKNPDRIYWSSTPVQFSDDGGKTVASTTVGIHVDHHAMWIDPNDPERIIVGNDGGVAITYDRGGNWRYLNSIAIGQFYHVSYNMDFPYRVCGGLQDNGTWCAPSRVARGQISNYQWASISGGDGFYSAQDPEESDVVYSESQGGNMGRSNLATAERTSLQKPDATDEIRGLKDEIVALTDEDDDPLNDDAARRVEELQTEIAALEERVDMRWNWNTPFFISPHDRMTFYAAGNKVVKSSEQGDNLMVISPDLSYADPEKVSVSTETTGGITPDVTGAETFATIVALAESPLVQGLLFAGTDDGRVWMSPDDGGEWNELTERFSGVPHGTWVSRIEPSHHEVNRFYVSFEGHRENDFDPYVYVTDDGGDSFRSISSDLPTGSPDFVHVIREDPHNPNLLFVGTDVGAYASTDRGASWSRFMVGLPTVPVHDLEIHPRDREIIAATHGRSIWIANIQPLEELNDARMAEAAVLFEAKPAFQWSQSARGGESYGQAFFRRPTPGVGASITYYLSEDMAEEVAPQPARDGAEARRAGSGGRGQGARGGGAGGQGRAPGEGRGGPGGPGANSGPQVQITVTDSEGNVVRELNGPGTAGVHSVSWNFRGEPPPARGKSPSEVRDSVRTAARAEFVIDSLIAAGRDEEEVRRNVGQLTGDGSALRRRFGGGFGRGGQGGDPEVFSERPGEQTGGGGRGRGGFGQLREYGELLFPGQSQRGLFRRFGRGGGGGQGELAGPGEYTITLEVGERTYTQTLTVEVLSGMGGGSPFGDELEKR